MTLDDANVFLQHVEGMLKRRKTFGLELAPEAMCAIVSQIQLALRHPGNTGPSAELARQIIVGMIGELEKASPGIGELLNRGFNPAYDVRRSGQ